MAVFSINVADADVPRIAAALCTLGDYGPSTPAAAKRAIIDLIMRVVHDYEGDQARKLPPPPFIPPVLT